VLSCWTALRNPTDEHIRMAEQHRKLAEKHRAAAEALRDAEAKACVGVSEYDRDISPFEHREDIASVEPLARAGVTAKDPLAGAKMGARITFREVPGLTAERLQRLVDCHLARNAVLGHQGPEMPDCPLVPRGVTAQVQQAPAGLAVEVRADNPVVVEEVWNRARRLAPQ
jgi:hypothetical protein